MLHDSQAKWLNKSTSLCNAAISLFTHLSHGDNMGVFTFADLGLSAYPSALWDMVRF